MIQQPHNLIDPVGLLSCPQFTIQGRVTRRHGNERVQPFPQMVSHTALFFLSIVVSLLLIAPVHALATDQVVEMPPMPGQAYPSPDQNGSKGLPTELPPEIKQIDEQIQRDASILNGGGVTSSSDAENQGQQAAEVHSVATDSAENGATPHSQTPVDKDADQDGHGGLIVFLVAAVGATLFLLRKYFRR